MTNSKCSIVMRLVLRPTGPAIVRAPTAVVSGDAAPDRHHQAGEFHQEKWKRFVASPVWFPSEPPFDGVADTSGPVQTTPAGTCTLALDGIHDTTFEACLSNE